MVNLMKSNNITIADYWHNNVKGDGRFLCKVIPLEIILIVKLLVSGWGGENNMLITF